MAIGLGLHQVFGRVNALIASLQDPSVATSRVDEQQERLVPKLDLDVVDGSIFCSS